jgi:hypothetical protein
MMPSWNRIGYSLVSVLVADLLGLLILAGPGVFRGPASLSGRLEELPVIFLYVLIFSAPGWLLALPVVLGIRALDGWRLWFCAVVGTLIGPTVMYGGALYSSVRTGYLSLPEANIWTITAASISVFATAIYIVLMKRGRQKSRTIVVVR